MHDKFQMSAMGELNFFLGLQVLQNEDGIFLSQDKYVEDILKKFGYSDVRSSNTPMDKENPWGKDETRKDVDLYLLYRSMIGSLMYLTASRPDIMFVVCACTRHEVTPKECHLHVAKRIFRYLKGYPKLWLWYPKESPFDLVSFSDSDYGGATQDRKSTTGGFQFFGRRLISWQCKKQTIRATSTTEAEYVAAANLLTKPFDAGRFQYLVCKLFPLLGKLSTVSVFLGFGLTFAGTSKYWGVLRILMIGLRLIPLGEHNTDFHPMVDFIEASPLRQYTKRTRIAQSFVPLTVVDEPASPQRDVSQREAFPTDSDFIVDQDRATIDKSSTLPHDSAPQVTSPAAVEGSMQQTIPELTALCTSLQRKLLLTDKFQAQEVEFNRLKERVKQLEEREGVVATNSGDDAPIKGKTTVLASRVVDVPTGSGSVPTGSGSIATVSTPAKGLVPTGSEEVPIASPVFVTATVVTPVTRRKGKETRAEQIARDAEIARIHVEEELQSMIDGLDSNNETVAKYLKEYRQFSSELPMERRIELISDLFNSVCKQMEDFIPLGLKEEAERIKRKGINLEQESAKKQKSSKEITEEAKSPEEVTEEKVHSEGQRSYWKVTRLGGILACYQFFIDLLKHLHRQDLNQLWRLVKETLSNRPPSSDKEMELWVELNLIRKINSKDKEIFVLVEKDYPLRKGLALVMIFYKLQVENFLQIANELVLKIYRIANSP
uniref:Reverse transcriptase Ty1/copia-type domain-containing protein n=1 Tax=Tanacetum cinerariifolium TaxID=118510 RepID=A0A699IIR7_TANCI|nr:hypothetical protein [Tanacetum cinerariifolium]